MAEAMFLRRKTFSEKSTIGELYMPDGSFSCFTLEDTVRNYKLPKETAIPSGIYEVVISWSNRFQRPMPHLLNVPFFKGIRIHNGNTPEHTEGCILVGEDVDPNAPDRIVRSMLVFDDLFPKIKKLTEKGKLFIQIEGGYAPEFWTKTEPPLGGANV